MKKKYYCAALLALLLVVGIQPASLSAVPTDDETSEFNNPAQAQHASNLAEEAAINNDSVKEASQELEEAQAALDESLKTDDANAIAAARETLAKAEEAYAKELADITGVIEKDISSMRASGMGWGQIAHELGVHPGLNGLGHTKGLQKTAAEPINRSVNKQELTEATARNLQSGWSKGHGVGVRSGVHKSGNGLLGDVTKGGYARGHDKDRGTSGFSGAGGLGRGNGVDGGRGNSGGNKGGNTGGSGGPGNSGGEDKAGTDGSPGKSGSNGNSGDRGKSSSDHGKSGDSHGKSGGKTK